jgi:hypothetical protein
MPNFKTVGQRNLKLLGGQTFEVQAPVTLTFDLVTSKSIGVIGLSNPGKFKEVGYLANFQLISSI